MPPSPAAAISCSSQILQCSPTDAAMSAAFSAKAMGVIVPPGSLMRSRARLTPFDDGIAPVEVDLVVGGCVLGNDDDLFRKAQAWGRTGSG